MDEFTAEVRRRVGLRIRRRRRFLDMSQEELALRTSVHRTQFTLIERGRRMPRLDTLIRICTVLDIPPCRLLEEIGWDEETGRAAGEGGDDDV